MTEISETLISACLMSLRFPPEILQGLNEIMYVSIISISAYTLEGLMMELKLQSFGYVM